ncbi:MAG: carboxypeptidase-like regulatory domain-containing protein [Planctomycetota bacterium]|nr:carboxypeptidase-like regulatory domain-containing protein [Planctomycetota bacterium]
MRGCIALFAAVTGLVVSLSGCSGSGGSLKTVAVTGTVTLKGQPVEGATVSFSPQSPDARAAFGSTNAAGRFSLTTLQPGDGALVGLYNVTIVKSSVPAPVAAAPKSDPSSFEAMNASKQDHEKSKTAGGKPKEPADLLPVKYKTASTSGLTADVKAGSPNDFPFALTE